MKPTSRRNFLRATAGTAAAAVCAGPLAEAVGAAAPAPGSNMAFGLVTYQWAKDWDLPTLIANCEKAQVFGVELRTTHAHGVEPSLTNSQRAEVKRRFAASQIKFVSLGSNERFDDPDPAVVQRAVEATKEFIRLSHDVGGTGVKVKPDRLHKDVPREKTITQIGRALNVLGQYGESFGQQVRLEVHGQCSELPTIKAIMDVADHPKVAVCWNSNDADLQGKGLEYNFNLVRRRFGATCHVRELNSQGYPYQQLIDLLVKTDYHGWVMLESGSQPKDRVAALAEQAKLFRQMVAKSQDSLAQR